MVRDSSFDASASPGVKFEVHGLAPPDHLFHPLTEFRCAAQAMRTPGRSTSSIFWIGDSAGTRYVEGISRYAAVKLISVALGARLAELDRDPVEEGRRGLHALIEN